MRECKLFTGIVLSVLFIFCVVPVKAEPIVHPAVAPARISLDVNLKGQNLTLLVSIASRSLPYLSGNMPVEKLVQKLESINRLVIPASSADCAAERFRIHVDAQHNINGYQSLECSRPEALETIKLELFEVLPELQEVDVWLITDTWQNKQVIHSGSELLVLSPELL
ncbi:ZrgA family zinc uptake protein [Spongorhabdus nitratireducens]